MEWKWCGGWVSGGESGVEECDELVECAVVPDVEYELVGDGQCGR